MSDNELQLVRHKRNEYMRSYRQKNKDKILEYERNYREKNKEKIVRNYLKYWLKKARKEGVVNA